MTLLKGTYVVDIAMEKRGFICCNGDEDPASWHDHTWLLLDEHGSEPDEGSWWARMSDVEVIGA